MKKLLALLLCLVMVLGLGTTAFAADAKSNDIVILHTDDVHCGVTDGMGYAGVAAYKAEMLKTTTMSRLSTAATQCRARLSAPFLPALTSSTS